MKAEERQKDRGRESRYRIWEWGGGKYRKIEKRKRETEWRGSKVG